jgi:serine/threonine protein kinase
MPWFPLRWNIALDIAKGLNYLHSKNIIHQDLKSMNILIDKDWKAKISDFGLATIKSTITVSMTSLNKNKIGSIRWNAPELFKRGTKRSKETDVYSFGMTLWEISSRKIPFSEEPDDQMVVTFINAGEKENIPNDCPLPFSQIITKCWNSNPNERPSMSDVIISLEKSIDLLSKERNK